jgi:hypothetical protein
MTELRNEIAKVLKTVTEKSAPRVFEGIQSELGYKNIEDKIINMMLDNNISASATIPHLENEL